MVTYYLPKYVIVDNQGDQIVNYTAVGKPVYLLENKRNTADIILTEASPVKLKGQCYL